MLKLNATFRVVGISPAETNLLIDSVEFSSEVSY